MYDRSAKLSAKGVGIEYWLHRSRTLFTAVQGVDLTVGDGEFVAIVGPSGCGKTTFLNAVDGLIPVSGGSLTLDGKAKMNIHVSVQVDVAAQTFELTVVEVGAMGPETMLSGHLTMH